MIVETQGSRVAAAGEWATKADLAMEAVPLNDNMG